MFGGGARLVGWQRPIGSTQHWPGKRVPCITKQALLRCTCNSAGESSALQAGRPSSRRRSGRPPLTQQNTLACGVGGRTSSHDADLRLLTMIALHACATHTHTHTNGDHGATLLCSTARPAYQLQQLAASAVDKKGKSSDSSMHEARRRGLHAMPPRAPQLVTWHYYMVMVPHDVCDKPRDTAGSRPGRFGEAYSRWRGWQTPLLHAFCAA